MMMTKKEWFMVALALALGLAYGVFFAGWFRPKIILVQSSVRSLRTAWNGAGQRADLAGRPAASITFAFPQAWRLTLVRVVSLDELATNRDASPVWHLVSRKGSDLVKGIAYGAPVPGMAEFVTGNQPRQLEPGARYRLVVEAGAYKGTNDFSLPAAGR